MNIYEIFLMFLIYSTIGWLIEVLCKTIDSGKFINRGFLIGPYCPIYGCGGVLITLFLNRYYDSPITLFVMAMVICALLEYVTSYLMEKLFNARWWDYSKYKYNINGRICLETMIPFGILGCTSIYLVNPLIYKLFNLFNDSTLKILAIFLSLIFICDLLLSFKIISNFKNASFQFRNKDNTEEITKKVKDVLYNKSPFTKRLIEAFPNFKSVIVNIKNELRKTKDELKITQKELKQTQKRLKKVEKRIKKEK